MGRYAPTPAGEVAIKFRHSHWSAARERVRRALVDAGMPLARRYAFQECGGSAWVMVDENSGRAKVCACTCHDRWCQACGRLRRQHLATALTKTIPGREARHLVLTLKGSHRPLRQQFDHLVSSFTKLRRSAWWRERVAGGAWTFELTWNSDAGQWHPHLHTIVHSSWLQLQELSEQWFKATGDSHRVHVSIIEQHAAAIREVSKYVGKILHRTWEHSHDLIVCVMKALNGRRLANTFGTWRGVKLDEPNEPDPEAVWKIWGTLDRLYELAKAHDPEALELIRVLHGKTPTNKRDPLKSQASRAPP